MAEPLVIIESLEKSFEHMGRTLHVLKGIDLNINAGEIMAIVGASGACCTAWAPAICPPVGASVCRVRS